MGPQKVLWRPEGFFFFTLLCAHNSYLYYIGEITHWYQKRTLSSRCTMPFFQLTEFLYMRNRLGRPYVLLAKHKEDLQKLVNEQNTWRNIISGSFSKDENKWYPPSLEINFVLCEAWKCWGVKVISRILMDRWTCYNWTNALFCGVYGNKMISKINGLR